MGALDQIYSYVSALRTHRRPAFRRWREPTLKFFSQGFGDMKRVTELETLIYAQGSAAFSDIDQLSWEAPKEQGVLYTRRATCRSPLASFLPEESANMHLQLVMSRDYFLPGLNDPDRMDATDQRQPVKGIMVHLAPTGDMGFAFRTKLMAEPMAQQGYASLLLIIPYYGRRKPHAQIKHYASTVADYLTCCFGSFVEAAKLTQYCRTQFSQVPVGLTGMSLGGAMACMASGLDHGDLVLLACVGSASPRVMVNALAKDANCSLEAARDRLAQVLGDFVLPIESETLAECMKAESTTSKFQWVPGGHVTAMLNASTNFVPALDELFGRLEPQSTVIASSPA
ncbi:uncharacterized protein MONBRDRAFT_26671 [Monosiga brevicollis MX1]|uniref:Uncharacterized protein n=1 Tax=Monosiga brevicollis TaxID=81824 RepID=A9V315_MONBE|nr:uncharacterized protein MONBRDRAFT_26671 [Monosiga brevicollis MX1]EDQ88107.1 predicted protein [Monosiga brevicollis MX1]|eukprot:XP_001747183.1 hypothetical protein [Monosiga brevicollis MX1]